MVHRNMTVNATPSPKESAREVGLRYVTHELPGIRRERRGQGFRYRSAEGKVIRDRHTLKRITSLAIPLRRGRKSGSARSTTGICRRPAATNAAANNMSTINAGAKYAMKPSRRRLLDFARALPPIRQQLRHDLKREGLCREKVLATVVRLLEVSLIRVGNEEYARDNKSYGLTTMKNRHATVRRRRSNSSFAARAARNTSWKSRTAA